MKEKSPLICILLILILAFGSCSNEENDLSTNEEKYTVVYAASKGGYVSGTITQVLNKGDATQTVYAYPMLCYTFKEWSDGVKTSTRSGDRFTQNTTVTAIFEYTGLPELYIEYGEDAEIPRYTSINAFYTLKNAGGVYEFESMPGQIQGRGNATWEHEKKPYKIKFNDSLNFLGIGDEAKRDWVILANHGDQSLLRNYYAYNLAYKAGIGYKSTLIEVYLNGEYNGVYMLTGKVEASRHDIDETAEGGGFLIELDDYYKGVENVDYIRVGKEFYTLKSDYINSDQMERIRNCIVEIDEAINSKDEERIKELLDIESCVKMYLLQEYTKNIDVGWSSFYLYKKSDEDKLHFGPAWDLDIAMGNDYRLDSGGYEGIYVGRNSGFVQQNNWYIGLCSMEWFRELALENWNEEFASLTKEVYSELREYANINWDELKYNFVRWDNTFGKRINSEPKHIMAFNTYKQHYDCLIQWLENRYSWLDACFNDSETWVEEINKKSTSGNKDDRK